MKFNDQASTPYEYNKDGRGCHSQRLAAATPVNIKYLENYVDAIAANGKGDTISKYSGPVQGKLHCCNKSVSDMNNQRIH